MVDKVQYAITAQDQSAAAFNSLLANARRAEGGLRGIERGLSFLTKFSIGGGVGAGVAGLVIHLNHLSEKLSDTNPQAEAFTKSMDRLRGVVDSGFISLFGSLAPIINDIASAAEHAAPFIDKLFHPFTGTAGLDTGNLTELETRLKGLQASAARQTDANSGKATRAITQSMIDDLQKQIAELKDVQSQAISLPGFADQNSSNTIKADATTRAEEARKKAAKESSAAFKKYWAEDADFMSGVTQTYTADWEEASQAVRQLAQDDADFWSGVTETYAVDWEEAEKRHQAALRETNRQAEEFGAFFADAVISAADGSFSQVMAGWIKLLAQMELQQEAADLFKSAGGLSGIVGGIASGVGSLFGGPGANFMKFADGGGFTVGGKSGRDANLVPLRLTRGEQVQITPAGAGRSGGVVINQSINVGAGASRAEVMSAMVLAKNAAIAEIKNGNKRGR